MMKKILIFYFLIAAVTTVFASSTVPVSKEAASQNNVSPAPGIKSANTIADIVDQVGGAVVNIDVVKNIKLTSPFKGFENDFGFGFDVDPGFKKFFEDRVIPQKGAGSGFIVDSKGYVITNNHVTEGAGEIKVTLKDGRTFNGKVVGSDRSYDISIVKIDGGNLPIIEMGDSSRIRPGEWIIAIGNPYQFSNTITIGIISATGRTLSDIGQKNLIQTDAAINPGNSGGALINLDGKVIGVNVAVAAQAQGIGFAIPINEVKEIMGDLVKNGKVSRPWLGVYMRDVDEKIANYMGLPLTEGVIITNIVKDSPAEKSGLVKYDVIRKLENKNIKTSSEVSDLVKSKKPGDTISMTIYHDGKINNINVKIGVAP